jgi:hypothetical protein
VASISLIGAGAAPFYSGTFSEVSPVPQTFVLGTDWGAFASSGNVTASVQPVGGIVLPPTPTPSSFSGCSAADFAGFTPGNIALIQRGGCEFEDKVLNAQDAGAAGVIIFNEGQPGRTDLSLSTLGGTVAVIPAVYTTYALGQSLYSQSLGGVVVRLSISQTNP